MKLSMRAKRMLRRVIATFCACACVFAVSACGADDADGKIRVGIKFDQPGLGFKKSGTYVGFDVDVAKYIAKKLGYSEDQIVWKEAPSKQREAMLQNGDVDYIVATYSITDERKKVVSFAGPYFVAGQDLLVRKDETSIKGPETSMSRSSRVVKLSPRLSIRCSRLRAARMPGYTLPCPARSARWLHRRRSAPAPLLPDRWHGWCRCPAKGSGSPG